MHSRTAVIAACVVVLSAAVALSVPRPGFGSDSPLTGGPMAFFPPNVTPSRAGPDSWNVAIDVNRDAGIGVLRGKVPFTAEPYNFTLPPEPGTILESDLFGTGLVMDLDGDGATTGGVPVACEPDGRARIGEALLAPLGGVDGSKLLYPRKARGTGTGLLRIGARGASVVLYTPCAGSLVSFGVAPADAPPRIHRVPGPVLQVLVIEEIPGPDAAPRHTVSDLRVNGKPAGATIHTSWMLEPVFTDEPAWAVASWAMVPFPAGKSPDRISLSVKGHAPARRLVIARVNVSKTGHDRFRSLANIVPLE